MVKLNNVVAHEIGHDPGSKSGPEEHAEGGLMGSDLDDETADPGASFTPLTIKRFREALSWHAD